MSRPKHNCENIYCWSRLEDGTCVQKKKRQVMTCEARKAYVNDHMPTEKQMNQANIDESNIPDTNEKLEF